MSLFINKPINIVITPLPMQHQIIPKQSLLHEAKPIKKLHRRHISRVDNRRYLVHAKLIKGKLGAEADCLSGIPHVVKLTGKFIANFTASVESRSDIMYTHSADNPARIFFLKNIKSEKL